MAERRKPTIRTLLAVAAWGTVTTTAAYLISGGSIPIFVAVLLALGIAQRVAAVHLARRRGQPRRGGGESDHPAHQRNAPNRLPDTPRRTTVPYRIETVSAAEILDSRGRPTLEVTVRLAGGIAPRPACHRVRPLGPVRRSS